MFAEDNFKLQSCLTLAAQLCKFNPNAACLKGFAEGTGVHIVLKSVEADDASHIAANPKATWMAAGLAGVLTKLAIISRL